MIDYNNLKCRECGTPVERPSYNITVKQSKNRLCKKCRTKICRSNGRTVSRKNAAIIINDEQKQIVLGSILGDGSLEPPPKGGTNWGLAIKHSIKQEQYLTYKSKILDELVSKVSYPVDKANRLVKKDIQKIRLRTIKHPFFTNLSQSFSKNGKKAVDKETIFDMNALGFAIWYMDDGCLTPRYQRRNGYWEGPYIRFCTNSFDKSEDEILSALLKEKCSVTPKKCQWKNYEKVGESYDGIRLSGEDVFTFLSIVRPFIHEAGMSYKDIPSNLAQCGPIPYLIESGSVRVRAQRQHLPAC